MYDQLGPAVNSGKSLFLYGAPGNGKTVVAEGIGRALGTEHVRAARDRRRRPDDHDVRPGQPRAASTAPARRRASSPAAAHDRRWEQIRRPVVVVGGELTLEMLDLTFNPIAKFYEAPIQMKANGGVFVVDDFGRQRIPPRDLLNRWIVPLESRVDYLTLHTGRKFEIPFNVFIIFATNLKPESLADEAFLRRIPYKIRAKNPTIEEYAQIFELNCRKRGLAFDPVMVEYLQRKYYQPRKLADARLPPARPGRAGRRHVPLPAARPGNHARPARRGVRQLLPRRDRARRGTSHETDERRADRRSRRQHADVRGVDAARRGPAAARPRPTSSAPSVVILTLFSLMAIRLAQDFASDRARHRAAAPRQRGAGRRADAGPAIGRRRSIAAGRARLLTAIRDVRADRWCARRRSRALAPEVADGRDLPHRPVDRRARQAVARPQLRPDAGEPRRRLDRPLSASSGTRSTSAT